MFRRLKEKWKLNWTGFVLVFTTFALGGSLCGYTGKKLMAFTSLDKGLFYYIVYIILVTIIWPLCVLTVSIPMGQFPFFKNYLAKMWRRISGGGGSEKGKVKGERDVHGQNPNPTSDIRHLTSDIKRIAIFASGAGSNAAKIIAHLKDHPAIQVALIVCNKPGAGVIQIAATHNIPVLMIEKEKFFRGDAYVDEIKHQSKIDFIVLAGFLWKVPIALIQAYLNRIINIHPALLPKYGGKGMYGMHVHEAIIKAGEKESGITIHYVNEHFDEGEAIFQVHCEVTPDDTPETLAQKIHQLEHEHFPKIVEKVVLTQMS
ncbi:MAG: phosphoribosylglycinamide formyltransferase [Sediminibacterium sp.]|jgi:formyltetrahydrofolate-dependent phosphoribosylglycinamide formyltransferase|uniref:phosphoribosylglycinamide formyltransferase n=1 Tax=Sediminibacterium sp. TaxID=1917865 RepID=UPI002AB9F533|nr:phosphoribosylglycinamide formyltransferase [Sediminibacterium sp.]MDZ4070666.1 phosphoribosylglycinamide formyltransferase [Sediminibacterium sp.]